MRERCEEEGMKIDLFFIIVKQVGVVGFFCFRWRYLLMFGFRSRIVFVVGRQFRFSGLEFQSWGEWYFGNNNFFLIMLIIQIIGMLKVCKRGENSFVDYKVL